MRRAAVFLEGEHDFKSFCQAGSQAETTVRTIYRLELEEQGPELVIRVTGGGFLYNMVRIIAGTLVEIGLGRLRPDAFRRAFESGSRLDLGMTAPPSGLELTEVRYPALAFSDPDALRWHEEE